MAVSPLVTPRQWRLPLWLTPWLMAALGLAAVVMTPVVVVLWSLATPALGIWQHLLTTVLPTYLWNTLGLAVGVGIGVTVLGTATAWLVTLCEFPGRRYWTWALLLPLAAPAYVLAYTYTDFLEVGGPFQAWLRQTFSLQLGQYWFPPVRSLGGAILMLVLTLYPYVYMAGQVAFREQSQQTTEVSRSLGCSPWQSFWRVALPLARPSLAGGIALALMETLNDYGTVQFFGLDTLTTGIYRTWYGMGDRLAASQLSALSVLVIIALLLWEQGSRQRRRYYQTFATHQPIQRYRLRGGWRLLAILTCAGPVILGFLLPAAILVYLALRNWQESLNARFWGFAFNSFLLSSLAAVIIVLCALVLAYGQRQSRQGPVGKLVHTAATLAILGYGIPGTVIAVGILIPLGAVDTWVDGLWRSWTGQGTGLVLSGTLIALQFAYLVRFLAVAHTTLQASLIKIRPQWDEAARSLGHSTLATLWRVHIPLLSPGLVTAALLVFVDVMKELPATLTIRPFNLDTLAVRAFQMASDERLADAMAPSLAIVLVGLVPVLLLNWQLQRSRPSDSSCFSTKNS
ncbi:MAG: iron ABC transporter permease [Thermostichales cyanobacterium DRC_bins_46]